jgi:hypothetical protein
MGKSISQIFCYFDVIGQFGQPRRIFHLQWP